MTRMRLRLTPLVLAFLPLLLDCAQLDPLVPSTCGNGVVDATEDCDGFPKGQCGAPASGPAQCRLLCGKQASGETLACPDGWGCSVSGFCRQPSGSFEAGGEPVSAGVTTMLVGDFDGDGKKDVLGSSGPTSKGRIHYFNDAAAPQIVALPGVLASPTIRDFDGDGRSDIAFGYSFRGSRDATESTLEPDFAGGYAIMLGQSDRAVVTNLFPAYTQEEFDGLMIPLAPTKLSGVPVSAAALPVLAAATIQPASGARVTVLLSLDRAKGDFEASKGYFKLLPGTTGGMVGEPITADIFDKDQSSTCGDVVVAYKSGTILVYSPCKKVSGPPLVAAWASEVPPRAVAVPGETITRVFVADLDDDTHQDLIIGTDASGGTKVRVAFGTGNGFEPLVDAPANLTDVPLAAGLLDRDPLIDFVIPGGVLFSSSAKRGAIIPGADGGDAGPGPVQTPAEKRAALTWVSVPVPTKRWTVAQVADVNRDDIPDVIGASAYEPDIDVLEGTRSIDMPPFTIPTTGSVTNLAVGDFDLDANGDIAFIQARPASSEREVAISYGRALAMPPESPRTAGRLDGMRQLFATPTGLTVTSTVAAGAKLPIFSVAVLLASGERQPVAPLLFLQPPNAARGELTTRALVAPSNSAGMIDLIGLVGQKAYQAVTPSGAGGRATYAVWRAPGTGPVAFERPESFVSLPNFVAVDKATDSFLVQLVSGDLDGDKNAEIVSLSPDETGQVALMFTVPLVKAAAGLPAPRVIPDRLLPGGVRSQLLDVDGDGHDDLVAVLRDAKTRLLQVNVFYGDGKGDLAIPPATITLPLPAGAAQDDYGALGFTQITTAGGDVGGAGGKRHELAIVTPKHLFRAFVRPDRGVDVTDATAAFGQIRYGSAIVAGDFDGDGVDDLAVADQGSIRVSRQKARLP